MRSSSHCGSYYAPPMCCFPCLPKSKDYIGSDPKSKSSSHGTVTEDKSPVIPKIEEYVVVAEAATGGIDGVGDDDKCYREVVVAPMCCFPCLPKSKDDVGIDPKSETLSPAAVTKDKPPVVQKIEEYVVVEAATGGIDGVDDDNKCYREVVVAPKSSFPCLPKSKDDAGSNLKSESLSPVTVIEDKLPVLQKIEEYATSMETATGSVNGFGDDDKCYREVVVAPKSCLKRANCEEKSKIVAKGNVKWRDLLGKDLTQVKEFEPSESGDSNDGEYTGARGEAKIQT